MSRPSIILFFLLTCLSAGGTLALQAKVPVAHKERLTENWLFLRQDIGNIWEAVRPFKAGNPESVPRWQEVTLPHCYNAADAVDPDVNYYQGPAWYKTQLLLQNPYPRGRTLLEFEGAGQKTEVYIYTTRVATHVGGYDSWNVDITEAVEAFRQSGDAARFGGKVPLSIRCDNSRDAEMIPSDLSDFNLYGGIYRYLNLVYLPPVSLERLHIEPTLAPDRRKARLKVTGTFYNPTDVRRADVRLCVKDADGQVVAGQQWTGLTPLGEQVLLEVEIAHPQVWDVDHPQLYTCEATVSAGGEQVVAAERFGFRHFEFVEKGPFRLNGRRLLLRGTHRHEDHAGVGAAMTEEQMVEEMGLMKRMGVNFIRLGHYQQSEIILRLCDELGILVWEEIPWCRGGVGGTNYRAQARRMLTDMIGQHYNHPAVIIWGLGNENDWPNDFQRFDQGEIRAFMSELNTLAHRLDPARRTAIRRCDFCRDIVDVYSPSIWAGWYRGDYKDYRSFSREALESVRHFLHVEWGADSHPGRHVEERQPTRKEWSETYAVKLMDWHLKEQEEMPWLTGTAFWPFKDFSTPVRPENPVPYVNQKGVVERDLTPKESYYVFQSYWTTEPMVHIYGHSHPVRWGDAGEKKEVLVYSNCPEVELYVNGVSQGRRQRRSSDFPAAGLRWEVVLQAGENRLQAVATTRQKTKLADSLRVAYQTERWGAERRLLLSAEEAGADTALVRVCVVDEQGIPCLDSRRVIRFELAGDGELIDNLGTAGGSRKVEAADGKASIRIRKRGGRSVVAVMSEQLETQFLTIHP